MLYRIHAEIVNPVFFHPGCLPCNDLISDFRLLRYKVRKTCLIAAEYGTALVHGAGTSQHSVKVVFCTVAGMIYHYVNHDLHVPAVRSIN